MMASGSSLRGLLGGDDRDVGELGCDPSHQRPFATVAVAACPDDCR